MWHINRNTEPMQTAPPTGRLAVLTPGMGAVATTLYAGVEAIKQGISKPIGSYSQMGRVRVPVAALDQLVFGGWDIFPENAYEAAIRAKVLDVPLLEQVRQTLSAISPMKAVFNPKYVKMLRGPHVKEASNKMDLALLLRQDIRAFMKTHQCERAVMVWCASTETYSSADPELHQTIESFEEGLKTNDPGVSPSQIYTYAALREGIPYANGSPNLSVELPCFRELAQETQTPYCGSDFKTGQTLIKTVIGPGLRNRLLGVSGWYSTNILGNRDGEVLSDPDAFRAKEATKSGVLADILNPLHYPDLYGELHHLVKIHYYPPRGDNKEGWDNIDIFGWLGYPMQIKINFLCRDSILAAPVALDLALFLDFAKRRGQFGIQEWLSFYFKAPIAKPGLRPEHDLSIQLQMLENQLKSLRDERKLPLSNPVQTLGHVLREN